MKDVIWSSRFRVHHRLAASYRNGRVFVMGDAAHVHSPAGGQGMNCGLIDACVLGQLLADVIRGRRPEAELDLYETLRRPAAAGVLALAGRLTGLAHDARQCEARRAQCPVLAGQPHRSGEAGIDDEPVGARAAAPGAAAAGCQLLSIPASATICENGYSHASLLEDRIAQRTVGLGAPGSAMPG